MVDYQLSCGIEGFFVNGLGAESLQLSNDERIKLTDIVCKKARGNVPVFTNVLLNSIYEAKELVSGYNEIGVDGICITPPTVARLNEDALYEYYCTLAADTPIQVHIYNQPNTCNPMSEQLVARIAMDCDNITGYKDSTQNIIMLQNLMTMIEKPNFDYLAGSDAMIWPMMSLGGAGVISLVALPFPKPVIEFAKLFRSGDYKKALAKNFEIIKLRNILKKGLGTRKSGYLYATELIGCPIRGTRLPGNMIAIADDQKDYIRAEVTKVGLL